MEIKIFFIAMSLFVIHIVCGMDNGLDNPVPSNATLANFIITKTQTYLPMREIKKSLVHAQRDHQNVYQRIVEIMSANSADGDNVALLPDDELYLRRFLNVLGGNYLQKKDEQIGKARCDCLVAVCGMCLTCGAAIWYSVLYSKCTNEKIRLG